MNSVCFDLAGETVRVTSGSFEVVRDIGRLWAPATNTAFQSVSHDLFIDEHMNLWANGALKRYPDQSPEVLAQLQWYLVFEALAVRTGAVHLHAAAVVWRGKRIFISGASGSGKSTLTRECVRDGAHYLSDDCLIVDQGHVFGMGRTIQFDAISFPSERHSYLQDCDLQTFRLTKKRGIYVFPLWIESYRSLPVLELDEGEWTVIDVHRAERDEIECLDSVRRLSIIHEAVITSGREYSGELGFGPSYRLAWNDPKKAFELLRAQLES